MLTRPGSCSIPALTRIMWRWRRIFTKSRSGSSFLGWKRKVKTGVEESEERNQWVGKEWGWIRKNVAQNRSWAPPGWKGEWWVWSQRSPSGCVDAIWSLKSGPTSTKRRSASLVEVTRIICGVTTVIEVLGQIALWANGGASSTSMGKLLLHHVHLWSNVNCWLSRLHHAPVILVNDQKYIIKASSTSCSRANL